MQQVNKNLLDGNFLLIIEFELLIHLHQNNIPIDELSKHIIITKMANG